MADEAEVIYDVLPDPDGEFSPDYVCGIYFIESQGYIKIGRATNIAKRLHTHQISNPLPLTILGHIPLKDAEEADRHERFLHDRWFDLKHRGEWFRATDELRTYIARKSKPWPQSSKL